MPSFFRWCRAFLAWLAPLSLLLSSVVAAPTVSNVRAAQRPGTNFVDIYYDLADFGDSGPAQVSLSLSSDGGATYALPISPLTGAVGGGVTAGLNRHIVWNAGTERPDFVSSSLRVRITATPSAPAGFVFIPAGSYLQGSPESEPTHHSNETYRSVILGRGFYLQATELTWTQWNEVRNWGLSHGYVDLPIGQNGYNGDASGTHPVSEVNWYDAVKWLNARSEKEGLAPVYRLPNGTVYRTGVAEPQNDTAAAGYRLPTEAEWEYSCRAGTTTAFYNGDITHLGTDPVDPNLDEIGWYAGNSTGTRRVGLKQPNAWGLYDMSGSVLEWCWDWYGDYGLATVSDPLGPLSGSVRITRGGCWACDAFFGRSAFRGYWPPGNRGGGHGFRVALNSVP